jgi:hypothetical protein
MRLLAKADFCSTGKPHVFKARARQSPGPRVTQMMSKLFITIMSLSRR